LGLASGGWLGAVGGRGHALVCLMGPKASSAVRNASMRAG